MVRVRFAPSPTGGLHIGGLRTALFNYLFARKEKGTFILRIEDTDQTRFVEGAEAYIQEALEWCGMQPDESPTHGGNYGPYRQSERKSLYKQYADQLIEQGNAYYAFDTEDDLNQMRDRLKKQGVPSPQYNQVTRMQMRNSLTLPGNEVDALLAADAPYVVRLKVPRREDIRIEDKIRGWVLFQSAQLDDKVILKSDGMPTYHLANVVDDHLMEITHVIRGEEWLPSTPIHVLLYKYLGWQMPTFAHLPLLLKPEGEGKLSKRDAEKHGFPIFPLQWTDPTTGQTAAGYRESGYLPDAMVNFLVLLGWNPGTNQEIFSRQELESQFKLERIGKSGIRFDVQKAAWFNQQYLRNLPDEQLAPQLVDSLAKQDVMVDVPTATKLVALVKERAQFAHDMVPEAIHILKPPTTYDQKVVSKKWNQITADFLAAYADALEASLPKDATATKALFNAIADEKGIKPGMVMQALRVAVTGAGAGPDLTTLIALIGNTEAAKRIRKAVAELPVAKKTTPR